MFGTNPLGYGPRLWLGCCGVYLQPSEPLKLLLIVYLAAYLADWVGLLDLAKDKQNLNKAPPPFLRKERGELLARLPLDSFLQVQIMVPTLIMTGLALLVLFIQRDLGTAFVLIFLYSVMVFTATGWWFVPLFNFCITVGAGFIGYRVFDVIRIRVDAWINPWLDPSGRSYQIVQSLMSVANGGIIGRGPGVGNPSLVPVAHSDFIFAAVAEESGFIGIIGLLVLISFIAYEGFNSMARM